jgi:HD superfamily phosphodiesterase
LNKALEHFSEKLFKLKDRMHFPLTKQIADEETKLMHLFVDEISDSLKKSKFSTLVDMIDY